VKYELIAKELNPLVINRKKSVKVGHTIFVSIDGQVEGV